MDNYLHPESSVTFLVWSPKAKGRTTLDIMLENIPFEEKERKLKHSIPPTNSQDFYLQYNLETPDAELVLSSIDNKPVPKEASNSVYKTLCSRGLSVVSYTLDSAGNKIPLDISFELKPKIQQ